MAKSAVESQLSEAFICPKCHNPGGHVERLSMSGTGASRFFDNPALSLRLRLLYQLWLH